MAFTNAQQTARLLRGFQVNLRTKLLLPLVFVIAGLTDAPLFVVRHLVETQAQVQIEQEASNAILTVQALTTSSTSRNFVAISPEKCCEKASLEGNVANKGFGISQKYAACGNWFTRLVLSLRERRLSEGRPGRARIR
jgi:hypothetical protein